MTTSHTYSNSYIEEVMLELGIWGTRGSVPVAERSHMEYGGNTSSYTLRTPANTLIFLDAGTGLRKACKQLNNYEKAAMVLSHGHPDHILGLGFADISYAPLKNNLEIYLPECAKNGTSQQFSEDLFPITVGKEMRNINLEQAVILHGGEYHHMDDSTTMKTLAANHPRRSADGSMLYRFDCAGASFVYATDFEIDVICNKATNDHAETFQRDFTKFISGASILLCDGQYLKNEYEKHKGWGHPYMEQIIEMAKESKVRQLIFTHHDPNKDDTMLRAIEEKLSLEKEIQICLAKEGQIMRT